MKNIRNSITYTTIWKIFFWGMLLQFFLHTFFTYAIGLEHPIMSIIWLWKEILLFAAIGFLLYISWQKRSLQWLFADKTVAQWQWLLIASVALSFIISVVINQDPLSHFAYAIKYDYLGFGFFIVAYHMASFLDQQKREKLIKRYMLIIKVAVAGGAIRRVILHFFPSYLDLMGYSQRVTEGNIGFEPPLIYRTQQTHGIIRNQFLFERPIHLGFFLTALWPFFYLHELKSKSLKKTRHRWFLFIFTAFTTFARSARGSLFLISIPMLLLVYKKNSKRIIYDVIFPTLVLGLAFVYVAQDQILHRKASTDGHILFFREAVEKIAEEPFFGNGAAKAGPGSHQLGDESLKFNPENQFLQIMVEFGIIGFIPWIMLFGYFILIGYHPTKKILATKKTKKANLYREWLVVSLALGMIGLSISGMVLHSFSDRMIVYPFMALFGLVLYHYLHKPKEEKYRET